MIRQEKNNKEDFSSQLYKHMFHKATQNKRTTNETLKALINDPQLKTLYTDSLIKRKEIQEAVSQINAELLHHHWKELVGELTQYIDQRKKGSKYHWLGIFRSSKESFDRNTKVAAASQFLEILTGKDVTLTQPQFKALLSNGLWNEILKPYENKIFKTWYDAKQQRPFIKILYTPPKPKIEGLIYRPY